MSEAASDVAGNVAGTVLGALVGGPAGALAGAATSPAIARMLRPVAREVLQRHLSDRERGRVDAVVAYAAERIEQKMRLGYEPRHDGFFDGEPGKRPAWQEIAEGVLIAAQRDHEEDKLRCMGNLLAHLAFDAEIDRGQANLLIRAAATLSYRQLCILALCHGHDYDYDNAKYRLRQDPYKNSNFTPQTTVAVLDEILDLERRNCLHSTTRDPLVKWSDVVPSRLSPNGWGLLLYRMMDLDQIPEAELQDLAALLR